MKIIIRLLLLVLPNYILAQKEPDIKPPDARGLYAIWYGSNPDVLNLPYIKGGQITLQWADVEPEKGKYNFKELDEKLLAFKNQNKTTTVQINGNNKPGWMYNVIPHHPDKISHQIQDDQGTLMFWHPLFIETYINLVKAYAAHLKSSQFLSTLAGVRMNFNALGTEQLNIPAEQRSLDQWIVPKGVSPAPAFTNEISKNYQDLIAATFINAFDGVNLFLRNNISLETENKFKQKFLDGKLMLFHTSSEIEPRNMSMEHNYDLFKKYARAGYTLAYAETWADAWGYHGVKQDERWTSPSQYTYWRMLSDLNVGVSLVAVYGADLGVAYNGKHPKEKDVSKYRNSFEQSFRFASMYAGYHASPSVAPGAWVAFRHNEKNISYKELNEFTGNYSFLMTQLLPDNTLWKNVTEVGPELQRFGAWAKVLPASQKIRLQMSEVFAKSLDGKSAVIRIIYFDGKSGSFSTSFGTTNFTTNLAGTNTWKTLEMPIEQASFSHNETGADITVTALNGDITFHMVNVERGDGLPHDVTNVNLIKKNLLSWQNPKDYDIDHINIYANGNLLKTTAMFDHETTLENKALNNIRITTVDEAGHESAGVTLKK